MHDVLLLQKGVELRFKLVPHVRAEGRRFVHPLRDFAKSCRDRLRCLSLQRFKGDLSRPNVNHKENGRKIQTCIVLDAKHQTRQYRMVLTSEKQGVLRQGSVYEMIHDSHNRLKLGGAKL